MIKRSRHANNWLTCRLEPLLAATGWPKWSDSELYVAECVALRIRPCDSPTFATVPVSREGSKSSIVALELLPGAKQSASISYCCEQVTSCHRCATDCRPLPVCVEAEQCLNWPALEQQERRRHLLLRYCCKNSSPFTCRLLEGSSGEHNRPT